jgi:hypothetical protein
MVPARWFFLACSRALGGGLIGKLPQPQPSLFKPNLNHFPNAGTP